MATRLLLVEDSAGVAGALRILFEASGYAVLTAGSVAEAVAAAAATPPDVMLLDLSLPDGSGLDVVAALAAAARLPRAIVALTGHDDDDVRARCLAAGCRAVLVKPVPARELLATVQSL